MILAWDNKADGATITVGSEIATLPGTNVKNPHLSKKWHTAAGVKSSYVLFDMGSAVSCSLLALLGSNLSSSASIRARASASSSMATTLLDTGTMKVVKSGYGAAYKHVKPSYLSLTSAATPTWAIDCTNGFAAVFGRGEITYSRNTIGTCVNDKGVLATFAVDVPRFGYDPVTLQCLGLLIEETRTNICLWSEDLGNAVWNKAAGTVVANHGVAPDGLQTADLLKEDTTNGQHGVDQQFAATANEHYVFSVYVKPRGRDWLYMSVGRKDGTFAAASFNVATGTVGTTNLGVAAKIEPGPNGTYRCIWIVNMLAGGTTPTFFLRLATADNAFTYAGNGDAGQYWWGAQIENCQPALYGAATSYIKTVGATAARGYDFCKVATAADMDYVASGGTLAVETRIKHDMGLPTPAFPGAAAFSQNASPWDNRIAFYLRSTDDRLGFAVITGAASQADAATAVYTYDTVARQVMAWATNDFAASMQGDGPTTDNTVTLPTVDQLELGAVGGNGGGPLNGFFRRGTYYQQRLPNAVLTPAPSYVEYDVVARYWRLDVEDLTVTDNLQVGRTFIGPAWKHDKTLIYPWSVTPIDESQIDESYGGQSHPDARAKRRQLDFALDYLKESEIYDNPFAMARANGVVKDVLAIPFQSGAYVSEQAVWGLCQAHRPIVHRLSQTFRQQITVRERL